MGIILGLLAVLIILNLVILFILIVVWQLGLVRITFI